MMQQQRQARSIKPVVRRTGMVKLTFHLERIQRNITDRPWRALAIVIAVAVGVSIAITIIAASDGIDTKINSILNGKNAAANEAGINIGTIQDVLTQTRQLLTKLAIGFTAALVGLITWVTMGQRRREISINLQQGEHVRDVVGELLGESFILCVVGGLVGIALGYTLCNILGSQVPLLPLQPSSDAIISIFPWTTLLSFGATAVIATYFAARRDTSTSY